MTKAFKTGIGRSKKEERSIAMADFRERKGLKAFTRPLLILCSVLLSVSLVQAEPVALGDSALDQVTAGGTIDNGSAVTITKTSTVTMEGEAQSGGDGLNVVTSSESTVANGLNVWELSPDVNVAGQVSVDQSNDISQESMPSYSVVDNSSFLTVNTTSTLTLSGSAQSNLQGMNIVNATGSAVSNGVNVARTVQLSSSGALGLSHTNAISHSR